MGRTSKHVCKDGLTVAFSTNTLADTLALTRAAWFYINYFGDPDDGVGADEDAINATTNKFPHLSLEHIVTALDHIQRRNYNRPFSLGTEEAEENSNTTE